jgi:glycosyltransferase involved in cell wall biosynthesis
MANSILLVTGIFPPDAGGPAKFASEFAAWAATRDTAVNVITYSQKTSNFRNEKLANVFQVDRDCSLPKRYLRMIAHIGSSARDGSSVIAVGAFLETFFASVIFRFSYIVKVPGDIVWERAKNNKVTSLGIEEFQLAKHNLKYSIFRFLYSQSLRRASSVIVPSNGLLDLCLRWGVTREKLELVYNSVDTGHLGSKSRVTPVYDLITVCRLVPWKRVEELVRYSAKSGRSLVIVGDGPERGTLESLALSLQAKVVFAGDVDHAKVVDLIRLSKLFVLNSDYEGLPHALIEARAVGIPTVARGGTGSDEVITDGEDGYLVKENQSVDAAIDFAFRDSTNWNNICTQAALDTKRRFNKEVNFGQILRLIKDVK